MDPKEMIAKFKEKSQGHSDIWQCTLEEFVTKVSPAILQRAKKHNLKPKVVMMATSFIRNKFELGDLAGTIEYEVSKVIEEALMYYVNVLGEDV